MRGVAVCCSLKAAARDYQKELNYQEAFKEAYVAYASPGLPSEVETLLASAEVRGEVGNFVCARTLTLTLTTVSTRPRWLGVGCFGRLRRS